VSDHFRGLASLEDGIKAGVRPRRSLREGGKVFTLLSFIPGTQLPINFCFFKHSIKNAGLQKRHGMQGEGRVSLAWRRRRRRRRRPEQ
jgi:hypothetical protein